LLKSSGNITLVVDNLEKRSLVRRQRDNNDRRMVQVQLTDTGYALISQLFPAHLAAIVEELSVLDLEEQAMLGRLCRKLGSQDSPQEYKD
jgi:MarR family 2-MHQ and catechol resistance regulon transcriptional repressor